MLIELTLLGGSLMAYWSKCKNKSTTEFKELPNKTVSPNFSGKKLLQDFKTSILGDERQ